MQFRTLIAFIFLLPTLGARADTVKVGLLTHFSNVSQVTITSTSSLVADTISDAHSIAISRSDAGITATSGDQTVISSEGITVTSMEPAAIITVSTSSHTNRYRGAITARTAKSGMTLINSVELDDYLLGVVPMEMPSGFKTEALKAQAIAARTYAWSNRGKHNKEGFDVCDGTHCQLYGGVDCEKERTSAAVRDTAGLVITYQGKLISAVYSSDCGGVTKAGDAPYLASVADHPEGDGADYCDRQGHCWTKDWQIADFEALLQKCCPDLSRLTSVSVTEFDASNRVSQVKLEAEQGSATLTGAKLRSLLGATVIKSTNFNIRTEDGKVVFVGKGFGHGVGLCQFGSNGLASPPYAYTCEQILKHYYTGVEIVSLTSSNLARGQ